MAKMLPRLGKKLTAAVISCCLPLLLVSCMTTADRTSDANHDQEKTMEPQPKKVGGRDYVYNRPHAVPADYVYRTERIFPAPEETSGRWRQFFAAPAQRSKESIQPATSDQQAQALIAAVHSLVDQLLQSGVYSLEEEQRLTVSTFVNLNDLYRTSALGRFLGEQVVNELRNSGLEMIDVRKTPNILILQKYGEFGMSRDMEELSYIHEAHATVVGTYSIAADQVFINARVLRNSDGFVLAAGSEVLQKNNLLAALLEDESAPAEESLQTVQIDAE